MSNSRVRLYISRTNVLILHTPPPLTNCACLTVFSFQEMVNPVLSVPQANNQVKSFLTPLFLSPSIYNLSADPVFFFEMFPNASHLLLFLLIPVRIQVTIISFLDSSKSLLTSLSASTLVPHGLFWTQHPEKESNISQTMSFPAETAPVSSSLQGLATSSALYPPL